MRRWEYDARELEVAEEGNMTGAHIEQPDLLDEVLAALHALGMWGDVHHSGSSKHGGSE